MDLNKQQLLTYLKGNRVITLATYGTEIHACIVLYGIDSSFNFYIITGPKTKHSQDIEINKNVACTIVDSHQIVTDKKKGAQIRGRCEIVTNHDEMVEGLKAWTESNKGFEHIITVEKIEKNTISSRVYKIKPTYIKFFNEELYGSEGTKEFNF